MAVRVYEPLSLDLRRTPAGSLALEQLGQRERLAVQPLGVLVVGQQLYGPSTQLLCGCRCCCATRALRAQETHVSRTTGAVRRPTWHLAPSGSPLPVRVAGRKRG